jgi:hypothetical protein
MKEAKSRKWLDIFDQVNAFMEGSLEKWNTIQEIRRTYDDFIKNLKKLKDLQPELDKDISAVKKKTADSRDRLLEKLFPVGNVLEVYAEDHRLGKKARSLLPGRENINSASHRKLLDHALRLHRQTDKYMHRTVNQAGSGENKSGSGQDTGQNESEPGPDAAKIEPGHDIKRYGLTSGMLEELHSAIQEFQSILKLHDDVLKYRKQTTRKFEKLIRANRNLLKNRLNKLMSVFSGTHPTFYREYREIARKKSQS